ncbi:MAG: sugar ABC transporter permease, partial [Spirochaetaceae bacterium]|nr:sugar ABC transporter permease [Spirochaetaceae bacterium]
MDKSLRKYVLFFLAPTLICFTISFVIPFLYGLILSFAKFTTVTNLTFVGFTNYIRAFSNPDFLNALKFSALFTIVSVITVNVIAFALAVFLCGGVKGTNIYRTIIFMPNLIGGIVLGYIWQFIINGLLRVFNTSLTVDPVYGFWGLVILSSWQFIGYMMIIYIAGIQSVSQDVLEAAKIDGANSFTILRKITVPLVMPSITIATFMTMVNSFKMFDQNLALTAGLPG